MTKFYTDSEGEVHPIRSSEGYNPSEDNKRVYIKHPTKYKEIRSRLDPNKAHDRSKAWDELVNARLHYKTAKDGLEELRKRSHVPREHEDMLKTIRLQKMEVEAAEKRLKAAETEWTKYK